MEVLFVRSQISLVLKVGKSCAYLREEVRLGGAFFSGVGDRGQLATLQVLTLVHWQEERDAGKELNHRGFALKSCQANCHFCKKVHFSEMILKVYLPSLKIRCTLLRGGRNSEAVAVKESPIPLSVKDPRERLNSDGESWAHSSRTAKNISSLKENESS